MNSQTSLLIKMTNSVANFVLGMHLWWFLWWLDFLVKLHISLTYT